MFNASSFPCMCVTEVAVRMVEPIEEGSHLLAYADITLEGQLIVRDIRVLAGVNGLFISFPNTIATDGDNFHSIVSPTTRQLREHIENCVLEKYQEMKDK